MPAGAGLRNTAGRLGWKIDTRGHGGFVVAAGSLRRDGRYRITRHREIAPLPAWLTRALTPATPTRRHHLTNRGSGRDPPRNRRSYLQAILDGESRRRRRRPTRNPAQHPARCRLHPRPSHRRRRTRRPPRAPRLASCRGPSRRDQRHQANTRQALALRGGPHPGPRRPTTGRHVAAPRSMPCDERPMGTARRARRAQVHRQRSASAIEHAVRPARYRPRGHRG